MPLPPFRPLFQHAQCQHLKLCVARQVSQRTRDTRVLLVHIVTSVHQHGLQPLARPEQPLGVQPKNAKLFLKLFCIAAFDIILQQAAQVPQVDSLGVQAVQ